jgi:hypothetical protein
MRGQAPPRAPLSPSELRDSIADALRIRTVADSLVAAGQARDLVDRAVALLNAPAAAGFGGGGAGAGGAGGAPQSAGAGFSGGTLGVYAFGRNYNDRPGETPAPAGGGGAGRAALFGVAEELRPLMEAFQAAGITPRTGSGAAAQAPEVGPGVYTVQLRIGGHTLTQPLRVLRGAGAQRSVFATDADRN